MTLDTESPTEIRLLPLAELTLHAINPRQTVDDADIEAMAESLSINGLVQNIAVLDEDGRYGVVAGGKRLRALKLLAGEGWRRHIGQPRYDLVPCRVTTDAIQAQAWALAENVTRSDLHPADEVRAYRAMSQRGSSPEMIARAFAKSAQHVYQRLALAALEEEVLDALKANRISIDVARALTLAQSPERQLELVEIAATQAWSAARVRQLLTDDWIPAADRRAKFIGLDLYQASGGRTSRDLFEGNEFLHDAALLDQLFKRELAARAEELKAEGWAWVEFTTESHVPWTKISECNRHNRELVTLPEADEAELDRLIERAETGDALTDEEVARIEELQDRKLGDWSDEVRAKSGAFAFVNARGQVEVVGAFERVERHGGSAGDDTVETSGGGEKPLIPQNCLDDLGRIRLAAQQTTMLTQHETLLDLLAYQLDMNGSTWSGAMGVSIDRPAIRPDKDDEFHQDARLPDAAPDYSVSPSWAGFEAFTAKGKKHRNEVLTRHLARSLRSFTSSGFLREVFAQTGAAGTIRKIWHPTAENFFGRVRVDYLDRLWAELLDLEPEDARLEEFVKLKKAAKAKELQGLFHDASVQEALGLSRDQVKRIDAWVPAEMWEQQDG